MEFIAKNSAKNETRNHSPNHCYDHQSTPLQTQKTIRDIRAILISLSVLIIGVEVSNGQANWLTNKSRPNIPTDTHLLNPLTHPKTSPNYLTERPLIELPIRFYMLEFESAQELNAQTRGGQLPSIVNSLNKIYSRASIKFNMISAAPMPIKASKLTYYGGDFRVSKDSTTIRYRLARAIGVRTPKGEMRVYILKNFPKGESEPAYYDSYLRAVVMAENSERWGKTHTGILAQELGIALGLTKVEIPNNMMFRKKPKSASPEKNKLLENQVMRLRQIADIELDNSNSLPNQTPQGQDENTTSSPKIKSIFDR